MISAGAVAAETQAVSTIILCADDFAISDSVSTGIEELAQAKRLSATSAIVTLPRWAEDGPRLARLAPHIAIGLHVNLTLGSPLGPMPKLAPDGGLPALGTLMRGALLGGIDRSEVAAEVGRQIARFREGTGLDPDFVDGHQHVHTLPGVRNGVLAALQAAFPDRKPLVRDPGDQTARIVARGTATGKSLAIALLARGFGERVRRSGFPVNDGFSGVSALNAGSPFASELQRFFSHPGSRHLVMCHPGHADAELANLDPVTCRREEELAAIMAYPDLPRLIWHPSRTSGAHDSVVWPGEEAR
jgi:predicted glycoside hydrolase/deacetylase ChbG (UPF0249 family)